MSDGILIPVLDTAWADWRTFISRALHADSDAAIRMAVAGDVLVLTAAPLHPGGLSDTMPLVLGMRMSRLASSSGDGLDVVVEARALMDRLARTGPLTGLSVPPAEVRVPWAGISPPRGPWEPLGAVSAAALQGASDSGIAEIAQGAPEGSGAHAVDALRRRVWSRTALQVGQTVHAAGVDRSRAIPAGAAFGAHVLGFIPSEGSVQVRSSGPWTRLTSPAGHILVR